MDSVKSVIKKCQCCGDRIFSSSGCGTEANGEPNWDYCSSCYKKGVLAADNKRRQTAGISQYIRT